MKKPLLSLHNCSISIEKKAIIHNLNLAINPGSIHAIMGPNGSGKSTLSQALAGHPAYTITGTVSFANHNLLDLSPDQRAHNGLFLAFQQPHAIPGLSVFTFLHEMHAALNKTRLSVVDFEKLVRELMQQLSIDQSFAYRDLNDGFSGGEKKRFELLQMLIAQPKLAILDEIDSGLDIDALQLVAQGINLAKKKNPDLALIIITHYQRILNYIKPDHVHVLCNGSLVQSGNASLVHELEQRGYDAYR